MKLPTDINQLYTIIYVLSVIVGVETILILGYTVKRFVRRLKSRVRSEIRRGIWKFFTN